MKRRTIRRAGLPVRLLEAGLWLFAASCATSAAVWAMQTGWSRQAAAQIQPTDQAQPEELQQNHRLGELFGRLDIAELGFSAPMVIGDDPADLKLGVGHVPGTATPGGLGNFVLAGHRDTFFRPLQGVHPGMLMVVTTKAGRWSYVVDRTEVVMPERVDMLDIGARPEMTLITCYPFHFVGAAPKRFIVHAHLLSVDGSR